MVIVFQRRPRWEHAAKGGQHHTYAGSNNLQDVAWYRDNAQGRTHHVGQRQMAMGCMI